MMITDKQHRANEARRLLDEPLLKEAFDTIEKSAIVELLKVSTVDANADEERRRRVDQVNTIRAVRGYLEMVIHLGKDEAPKLRSFA